MKKRILGLLIIILCVTGCFNNKADSSMNDNITFKNEYESLNNKIDEKTKKEYYSVSIADNNPIVYKNIDEIVDLLKSKESFIVYFGYSSCDYCRISIPVLLDTAYDLYINRIYYVDIMNSYNQEQIKEKGEIYKELTSLLNQEIIGYPVFFSIINGKVNQVKMGSLFNFQNDTFNRDEYNNAYSQMQKILNKHYILNKNNEIRIIKPLQKKFQLYDINTPLNAYITFDENNCKYVIDGKSEKCDILEGYIPTDEQQTEALSYIMQIKFNVNSKEQSLYFIFQDDFKLALSLSDINDFNSLKDIILKEV